jgi:biopolymer transport protein ExbD
MKIHAPSRKERNLLLDMTPMIDIVFLLLIFFLTTMQLARESRAEVELPVEMGEKDPAVQPAGLILNVLADGSIVEGERVISIPELDLIAMAASGSGKSGGTLNRPLIRADRNAPAGRLNQVMNSLRRAGLSGVRLATSPPR